MKNIEDFSLKSSLNPQRFWKGFLRGFTAPIILPTLTPDSSSHLCRQTQEISLLNGQISDLITFAQRNELSLYPLIQGAVALLLSRYTNETDILFGATSEKDDFTVVPVRAYIDNHALVLSWLREIQEQWSILEKYESTPLEQIQEWSEISPELPLFETLVIFGKDEKLANFEQSKYPLILFINTESDLLLKINYDPTRFGDDAITRMLGHLETLLTNIINLPEQTLGNISLLTESERHKLLFEWNQTEVNYPQEKCIHQLFEEQVEKTPDAVALIFKNEQLTYRELNQRANQLANYLQSLGVQPEVLVGICVERSLEMIVGILGILKAGGAYVPLDIAYPKERLAFMLSDSQVSILLTQQHLVEKLPEHQAKIICLDTDEDEIAKTPAKQTGIAVKSSNIAYIIYTSGSTGKPKGVLIPHYNVIRLFTATQSWFQFNQNDVWSMFHSYAFDFSVWEIWGALLYGGRLVIIPYYVSRSPELFYNLLYEEKITVLNQTPSAFRQLIQLEESLNNDSNLNLRFVIFGGEALDIQSLKPWFEKHGDKFPQLVNMYGITETTVHVTYRPLSIADLEQSRNVIGCAIPDLQIYILNSQLQPVPIGVAGEIHVGGAGLARGYLNQPELTSERFIFHPFNNQPKARLYKTGDLACYLPNGDIEYLGRIDNQVKIRGFRIELGEIEAVLNQHPNLKETKVITREDIPGDKRLVAYIIPTLNQNSQAEIFAQLRQYLKENLPDYMIPSAFVVLEAFPLTTNGKIDYRALPAPNFSASGSNYVAPRTPTEEIFVNIWSELLKVEVVGINDNFFELGGHSLIATQVISRIRQILGLELSLQLLFESPTIAQISEQIGNREQTDHDLLVPLIEARKHQEILPLSFAQQRLWFLDQLEPNSTAYYLSSTFQIQGSLNISALAQSLAEIIQRHEILHTNFVVGEGQPTQVITHNIDFSLPIIDLQSLPDFQREIEAQKIVNEEAKQPFNLAQDSLFRVKLLQLSAESHLLLFNIHHIIFDGWSFGVLFAELEALYTAYSEGLTSVLPQLPIQYADFTLWQRKWLTGEVLASQLNYWKGQLGGILPILELPTDRPRPPVQTYIGATKSFILSPELTASIKALCQKEGVTLFMTLLTVFKVLLCRYSGQEDVIVGTPIAGRSRSEIEGLMGFFVNTLALRTDLADNPSFRKLLGQVRRVCLEAYTHQDVPFEQLVEVLQPERHLSHTPIFQVMFALQNAQMGELQLSNLNITALEQAIPTAKFDLTLSIEERNGQLISEWEYNTDLFDGLTIERMIGHFQVLLSGILVAPEQSIWELPLLTEKERHQLLVEWNQTEVNYPQDKCIHELFEEQVQRTPDAVAVVFENQQLTYQELNQRANQLANYLQTLGVSADKLVGLCLKPSLARIIGLLGILKAGGVYLPIDPVYPQERLRFMIEDSQVDMLLTQESLSSNLSTHSLQVVKLDADWEKICTKSANNLYGCVTGENLAYVIYTSGSTGIPKGVLIEHHAIANHCQNMVEYYQLNSSDRILQFASLSFDVSLEQILSTLAVGATLILVDAKLLTPWELHQKLIDCGLTVVDIPPVYLTQWLQSLEENNFATSINKLRLVIYGGEELPAESLKTWQNSPLKRIGLINAYGLTETTITAITFAVPQENTPIESYTNIPIGRPLPNRKVYILDYQKNLVPIGVAGELYIGGEGLARGYLNRPELTADKFISNPFDNSILYKTGDLACYLPDGNIEFLGRVDNQVKIRGFRIELGEIEAVLNQHPTVRETKVITREDIPGDQRLFAYIIPTSKEHSTSEISHQLRQSLQKNLPDYMIPAAFVVLEAFPLTTNGKIDYRALPAPDFSGSVKNYVAPRSPTEEIIANIWSQVIKVEKIGIYDNFFELGGHSLLVTQVISHIRQTFKLEIPLRLLFECPTIAQLSSQIGKNNSLPVPEIEPRKQSKNLPLSFAQQRLWFIDQLDANSTAYNMPSILRILGSLNISALEKSINQIIQRHEILRTNVISIDGQPIQVITNNIDFNLPIIDLQFLPDEQRAAETEIITNQEAQQPFYLAEDSLFRVKVLRLNPTEHLLLFNFHHIIFDGWSDHVFRGELAALYQAFSIDNPSLRDPIQTPLSPLPIQYADFALWQRHWLTGSILESQLSYWKQHLGSQLPFLELPTDKPRPSIQTFHGRRESFLISSSLTQSLKTLSQQEGTTLFMTMLAVFYVLLYRYSGQQDIVVGTPIAGRHRLETESLIGFFVNTLCLRIQMEGNPSFVELLKRVREISLGAYDHQDMPFEKLVEELQPERDLSRSPIFQVMFILQNTPKSDLELPGLTLNFLETDSPGAKFDLTLSLTETEDHLIGNWTYNTDLFDSSTIARMTGHFQTLLAGIVANPSNQIAQLPLLTATERQQMLVELNNTYSEYPQDTCIHHLFESVALQTPNTVAVVFETQKLTYQELNCRANQLAYYLQQLGVGPEVTVGIAVERSLEMIVGVLGIFKAGGAYVPLDPALPQARLDYMLKDTKVGVLLTQKHLAQNFPDFKGRVVYLDQDWQEIDKESSINPTSNAKSHNLAYIIYTSGSTGQPKGVMVEHHSLCGFAAPGRLQAYYVNSDSRVLLFGSLSFSTSLSEIFMTFMAGATLYIARQEDLLPGPRLADWLREYAITHIKTTPSVLAAMPDANFPLLSVITVMGEPSSSEVLERWLPGRTLLNSYGATEASVSATRGEYKDSSLRPSIGHPIANTQIYLLDTHQQPVPVNVPGEIYIAGAGVARGYINHPDLTAERFIINLFSNEPKARMYKTGDLAIYLPDGEIVHLGRIDNQVKIRGFRIELGEIETILGQHPSVQKVVVIAREDSPSNKRLVAYLVLQGNQKFSRQEMRVFLEKKVPNYMIPAAVVILDFIPLTVNGKLDRMALPVPKFDNSQLEDQYTTTADNLELQLTKIWENVLGIQPIGLNDNFFDVGGHSLLAVRLFAQIEKIFSKYIPLATLFQAPTIRQLANVLRDEGYSSSWSSLVPIKPHGSKIPFFYIHTLSGGLIHSGNLLSKFDADQPVYGLQAQGLDGNNSPHTCIEDMASHYIKEMQTVQPHGPYLLGGWCVGGMIAYEIAQQLNLQGEIVELLTIFDAYPPKMIPPNHQVENSLSLLKIKSRIYQSKLYLMDMIKRNFSQFVNLTTQQQIIFIWEKINRRIEDKITEIVYQFYLKRNLPLPHSLRNLVVRDAIGEAYRNYYPKVYAGKVIFFRAVDQPKKYTYHLKKWEELAAGGLEIHDIPGNHDSIMSEPHVSTLAEKLKACIQRGEK